MTLVLTTDHPAWQTGEDEQRARAVRTASGTWVLSFDRQGLHMACVQGTEDVKPTFVTTDPARLPAAAPLPLRDGLNQLGTTQRLANPWLWDAITTAILRQVVRADQARKLYRAWCGTYGTTVDGPFGTLAVAPTAGEVLCLAEQQFTGIGAKFHRTALEAAARYYERHHSEWEQKDASDLAVALTRIPRIGPWTAAAAAADFTGDFSIYPHDDLAVRTWAAQIAPEHPWPGKKDKAFGPMWTGWAAADRAALHTLTLATLTWGSHARADLEDPCGS
jgi:3-methyladenine DNA glycosylase/8-oxoguanine DNA glycosylase